MKITCAASNYDTGARIDLPNSAVAGGNDIVLDLWMYVTAGDIGGVSFVTNASSVTRAITKTGQWVRRIIRFNGVVGADTNGYRWKCQSAGVRANRNRVPSLRMSAAGACFCAHPTFSPLVLP